MDHIHPHKWRGSNYSRNHLSECMLRSLGLGSSTVCPDHYSFHNVVSILSLSNRRRPGTPL